MASSFRRLLARAGRRIRAHREIAHLTQREVAERAGLTLKYYGGIERGRQNITLNTLQRIADALRIDPGDVLAPLEEAVAARLPQADRFLTLLELADDEQRDAVLKVLEGFAPQPSRRVRRRAPEAKGSPAPGG